MLDSGPNPTRGAALSANSRQFLTRFIQSVEQLEILCLLCEHPENPWNAEEIFRVVQSSLKSVSLALSGFLQAGLLARNAHGYYQFAPDTPELEQAAQELARAYRERRVSIIEMIYHKPDPIQTFAEAFRLRRAPESSQTPEKEEN